MHALCWLMHDRGFLPARLTDASVIFDKNIAHELRKNTDHMSILIMNTPLYH